MSNRLSEQQVAALDAYDALMSERPELFSGRKLRPIVRDRIAREQYAAAHGLVLGVAVRTRYTIFVVDLVESRTGEGMLQHPYERLVSSAQLDGGTSVVVIGTVENPALGPAGHIVLVEQERHALGTDELELPRGFGTSGLSGEQNALRELEEETGYTGDHAHLLGSTVSNSGHADTIVSFYHVPILRRTGLEAEVGEAITRVDLKAPEHIWHDIRAGRIRDGFTVQALGLYSLSDRDQSERELATGRDRGALP